MKVFAGVLELIFSALGFYETFMVTEDCMFGMTDRGFTYSILMLICGIVMLYFGTENLIEAYRCRKRR